MWRAGLKTGLPLPALVLAACSFSAPGEPVSDAGPKSFADAAIPDGAQPPDGFDVASLTFRDGAGYQGTRDSWLIEQVSDSRGDRDQINWDLEHTEGLFGDNLGESISLLSFEIFGEGPGQVPPGATIARALLILVIFDGAGEPTEMVEVLVPWDESTTWATFGAAAGPQSGDDYDPSSAIPFETTSNGAVAIDVSRSVTRWSSGQPNYGWLFRAGGTNGTDVRSREFSEENQRPALVVDYLVPSE